MGPFGTKGPESSGSRETPLQQLIRSKAGVKEKLRTQLRPLERLEVLSKVLQKPGDSVSERITVEPDGALDKTYNLSEVHARPFRDGIRTKRELIALGTAIHDLAPGLIEFTWRDLPDGRFSYVFTYTGA
jgi:hypothetical protein